MNNLKGYESAFLGRNLKVALPQWGASRQDDIAPVTGGADAVLRYPHHSVVLSKKRKFPVFTAVNINSAEFQNINRDALFPGGSDRWEIDKRAQDFQWGAELYTVPGSDFDRGHLVKREDPQWGSDVEAAKEAARSTFYYANCVPQVSELNQREWRNLEDYILKKESAPNKLKVSVFTGPVLSDDDPVFVQLIKGQAVQIPALFWKIIYFSGDGKTLNRVAFLMGQQNLLLQKGIAKKKEEELEQLKPPVKLFDDFEDAAMYQVNIALVEKLTGLAFSPASEPYKDTRPAKVVLKQVEVNELESFPGEGALDFELEGLVLR